PHPRSSLFPYTTLFRSVVGAVKAGAIGYLLKDTQAPQLRRAIKAAAAGQVQLSPQAAAYLLSEVRAPETAEALTERRSWGACVSDRKSTRLNSSHVSI